MAVRELLLAALLTAVVVSQEDETAFDRSDVESQPDPGTYSIGKPYEGFNRADVEAGAYASQNYGYKSDDYFGAANPWFVAEHQASKPAESSEIRAFPKSRLAVESKPSGISLFQARTSLLRSQHKGILRRIFPYLQTITKKNV